MPVVNEALPVVVSVQMASDPMPAPRLASEAVSRTPTRSGRAAGRRAAVKSMAPLCRLRLAQSARHWWGAVPGRSATHSENAGPVRSGVFGARARATRALVRLLGLGAGTEPDLSRKLAVIQVPSAAVTVTTKQALGCFGVCQLKTN